MGAAAWTCREVGLPEAVFSCISKHHLRDSRYLLIISMSCMATVQALEEQS